MTSDLYHCPHCDADVLFVRGKSGRTVAVEYSSGKRTDTEQKPGHVVHLCEEEKR